MREVFKDTADPTPITRGDLAVLRNEVLLLVQSILDGSMRNGQQMLINHVSLMFTGIESRLSTKMEDFIDAVSNTRHA